MASYNEYLEYLKHIDNTTEQEIKTKIDGLNKDITHLKESLGKLSTVKDDLTYKLNEANTKINENFHTISIKQTEIASLKNDISDFTLKLKDAKEEIGKSEKQKSKDEKRNVEISEQLKLLTEKYNKLQNEFQSTNGNIKNHLEEIQILQSKFNGSEQKAQNLSSTKADLESKIQKYQKEIAVLNSSIANLKNNNLADKVLELENKITLLNKNIRELETDNTSLSNELSESKGYSMQLNKTLSEKNEQLKNAEPKGKLKYILGAFSILLLITSIYYYSKYNNLQSKYGYLDYKNSSDSKIEEAATDTTATPVSNSDTSFKYSTNDTVKKVLLTSSVDESATNSPFTIRDRLSDLLTQVANNNDKLRLAQMKAYNKSQIFLNSHLKGLFEFLSGTDEIYAEVPEYEEMVQSLAVYFQRNKNLIVNIWAVGKGYTGDDEEDETVSKQADKKLWIRRAKVIKKILISAGVEENRIGTQFDDAYSSGHGENHFSTYIHFRFSEKVIH